MASLSDLFSDIFARQNNLLTRVDPRTKLVAAVGILVSVLFSTNMAYPLALLAICVGTTAAVGVPLRLIALRLTAPMGIALVLVVLKAFLTGSTPLWSINLAGWPIAATREGLRDGLLIATRMLGAMSVVFLLSSVTPAHGIFRAMRALGAPQGWVEIALLMYRYIFVLLDLTADVTSAQRVRLGYAGLRRGLHSAGLVGGTVILRSMDQAVQTNQAMKVRCYRGDIPLGPMPPFRWRDVGILCAIALLAGAAFFAAGRLLP